MSEYQQTEPELMTVSEAARYLRVSRSTVYEACRCNQLPHIRVRGRIRIPRQQILKMADKQG